MTNEQQTPIKDETYLRNARRAKELMAIIQTAFVNMHLINSSATMHGVDLTEQNFKDMHANSCARVNAIFDKILENDGTSPAAVVMNKTIIALCQDFLDAAKVK